MGTQVKIIGRVQSRQYEKKYEDGTSEMKVAYEVSICSLELINEEGTEKKEGKKERIIGQSSLTFVPSKIAQQILLVAVVKHREEKDD